MSERWSDETVALVLKAHDKHTVPVMAGVPWPCSCGVVSETYEEGRRHLVEVVLEALADAGLLVEVCRCGKPRDGHCDHCHDDPPAGHVCPRCGVARMAFVAAPNDSP